MSTTFDELHRAIPDWAEHLRLNLATLEQTSALTPRQARGTLLACALATHEPALVTFASTWASELLGPAERDAVASVATTMAMTNVYFRFTHLVSDDRYRSMPSRLRMQILGKPGVPKLDYELWCLAVSALHGCAACIDRHERAVLAGGGVAEQAQEAVRIAAISAGVAQALVTARQLARPRRLIDCAPP